MNYTIKAEIYKLLHTKSCYVPLAIFLAIAVFGPVVASLLLKIFLPSVSLVFPGASGFVMRSLPMILLVVIAVISPTIGEYNNKVNHLTLADSPRRTSLVMSKLIAALIVVGATIIIAAVLWPIVASVYGWIDGSPVEFNNRLLFISPALYLLTTVFVVMIGQGISHLTRSFPMTFLLAALILINVPYLLAALMSIDNVLEYTFARNLDKVWEIGGTDAGLVGQLLPLVICVTWAVAIFGAGLISYGKRNA